MSNTIIVRCACGEVFHTRPEDVGRRIRCRCGRTLEVRPRNVRMSQLPRGTRSYWRRARQWLGLGKADPKLLRKVKLPRGSVERFRGPLLRAFDVLPWACWGYLAAM